jgi:hypothetical protein
LTLRFHYVITEVAVFFQAVATDFVATGGGGE